MLEGGDTMSAEARNFVFQVKVTDARKKEAMISRETLQKYRQDVEQYLKKPDGKKP
jgi:hypothetical protein